MDHKRLIPVDELRERTPVTGQNLFNQASLVIQDILSLVHL
jgi:hypothetical protein